MIELFLGMIAFSMLIQTFLFYFISQSFFELQKENLRIYKKGSELYIRLMNKELNNK